MADLHRYRTYYEIEVNCCDWVYHKFYVEYDDEEFKLIEL